jgi:dihydroneopterin aldolase
MQKIIIEQLQVPTLIGVYDFERTQNTQLLISIELYVNVTKATISDDVADTVDYAKIAELVKTIAAQSSFQLLEALGRVLCQAILDNFAVKQVTMKLEKPDILADTKTVSVSMCFDKQGMLPL